MTVYRDGSRHIQVLSTEETKEVEEIIPESKPYLKRPSRVVGITEKINTPMGKLYVTVNHIDGKPIEAFIITGKAGKELTALCDALGRLFHSTEVQGSN